MYYMTLAYLCSLFPAEPTPPPLHSESQPSKLSFTFVQWRWVTEKRIITPPS